MGDKASDDRMSLPEGLAQRQCSQRLVWLAKWASFGNRTEGGLRGNRIQFKPAEWAGVSGIKTDPLRAAVHWLCFPWVNYLGEMVGEGHHGGGLSLSIVYCCSFYQSTVIGGKNLLNFTLVVLVHIVVPTYQQSQYIDVLMKVVSVWGKNC